MITNNNEFLLKYEGDRRFARFEISMFKLKIADANSFREPLDRDRWIYWFINDKFK